MLESLFIKAAYTGVFLWNWKSYFINGFIYRTPPVAASWFLQQSSVIFSVITINLGYNQKLSWKYCNYFHLCFCKNIHLLSKDPVMTLSSIYNFHISIFLRVDCVSHGNTVYLTVSLSQIDCPIYQEEELTSV